MDGFADEDTLALSESVVEILFQRKWVVSQILCTHKNETSALMCEDDLSTWYISQILKLTFIFILIQLQTS